MNDIKSPIVMIQILVEALKDAAEYCPCSYQATIRKAEAFLEEWKGRKE